MNAVDKALPIIDEVMAAAEHGGRIEIIADALITRGSSLWWAGQGYQGRGVIEVGERLAALHNLPRVAFRGFLNRSEFEAHGDPSAGMGSSQTGLATARRLGRRPWLVNILVYSRAPCAMRTGQWEEVLGEISEAIENEPDDGQRTLLGAALIPFDAVRGRPVDENLAALERAMADETDPEVISVFDTAHAYVSLAAGRLGDAHTAFMRAVEPIMQAGSLMAARAALWNHDVAAARAARQAIDGLGLHGPAIDARAIELDAGIAALDGEREAAIAGYAEATARWRAAGLPWDQALTALTASALLGPDAVALEGELAQAHETLERLGATAIVTHLELASA
jgi:hypothetical protein